MSEKPRITYTSGNTLPWFCIGAGSWGYGCSPKEAYDYWAGNSRHRPAHLIIKYADHPPLPFIEHLTPEPKRRTFLDWLLCR